MTKVQLGKLDLKIPLADMVKVQKQENDLNILAITLEHIYQLQMLSFHHNDPFDRLIIAQSFLENMTIISADGKFKDYGISVIS